MERSWGSERLDRAMVRNDAPTDAAVQEKQLRTKELRELMREGLTAIRERDFHEGYRLLGDACDRVRKAGDKLPAPLVSYYGLCLGMVTDRQREAAEMCQAAIDAEPMKADYYANLVEVCIAANLRRKAVTTVDRGLAIDAGNARLLRLQQQLGKRRPPVIGGLDRSHPVNVTLGIIRHSLTSKPAKPARGGKSGAR